VVEIRADGILDYPGSYEEYVHACGDDHLDADTVVLKARRDDGGSGARSAAGGGRGRESGRGGGRSERKSDKGPSTAHRRRQLETERDEVTARITAVETRLEEIDAAFCAPDFFERSSPDEVSGLEAERTALSAEVDALMKRWEKVELDLGAL
jgi:hypothetical protein